MGTLMRGLIAGAAGTTALNAVTYLDMALRGRPASTTPEQSVRTMASLAGVDLGEGEAEQNRTSGLGALLGYASGISVGAAYGVLTRGRLGARTAVPLLTGAAMVLTAAPMTALGITDPRQWSRQDWIADVVPHLAYGIVVATAYRMLRR